MKNVTCKITATPSSENSLLVYFSVLVRRARSAESMFSGSPTTISRVSKFSRCGVFASLQHRKISSCGCSGDGGKVRQPIFCSKKIRHCTVLYCLGSSPAQSRGLQLSPRRWWERLFLLRQQSRTVFRHNQLYTSSE